MLYIRNWLTVTATQHQHFNFRCGVGVEWEWSEDFGRRVAVVCHRRLNSNCLSCARSVVSALSSSETMCQLNECAQPPCECLPLQTSEMGDTRVYFIRSVAKRPRSEPTELQNLHKNTTAGLFFQNNS